MSRNKILLLEMESFFALGLAPLLVEVRLPVKAMVNPKSPVPKNFPGKAEFVSIDWRTFKFSTDFFADISAVVYFSGEAIWDLAEEKKFIETLVAAGVSQVVRLEEAHAKNMHAGQIVPSNAEQFLSKQKITSSCVRTQITMQSLLSVAEHVRKQDILYSASGGKCISFIEAGDIAKGVVKILLEVFPKNNYLFTGPLALSPFDVAEALSEVLGRPILSKNIPAQQVLTDLSQSKVPAKVAENIRANIEYITSGAADICTDDLEILGVKRRTINAFLRAAKAFFVAPA